MPGVGIGRAGCGRRPEDQGKDDGRRDGVASGAPGRAQEQRRRPAPSDALGRGGRGRPTP